MNRREFNKLLSTLSIGTEVGGYLIQGVHQWQEFKGEHRYHLYWAKHVKGVEGDKGKFQVMILEIGNMRKKYLYFEKKSKLKVYLNETIILV